MESHIAERTPDRPTFGEAAVKLPDSNAQRRDDDTIDLTYLFWVWVKWSWLMVLAALVGMYLGYRDLRGFRPEAVASMVVLPATSGQGGGGGPAISGGLAAAAAQFGIQLGQQTTSASPFERFKLVLGSMEFAQLMQDKHRLMQIVYKGGWDPATQTWTRPNNPEFERDQRLRTFLHQNLWAPPNIETLADYISGSVRIEPYKGSAFYELTVRNIDGDYAVWLLDTVFNEADEFLREKDRQQSAQRRTFIEKQLESRSMIYIQDALRQLLSQELSKEVSLSADARYAAAILEPPHVLNRRTEPNILLLFGVPAVSLAVSAFLLITLIAVVRAGRA